MSRGRIVVAKVGLDGHDRGALVVGRILRDAGFEVIVTGRFQSPEAVAAVAVQEDVDVVGLSLLSGAHLTLVPRIIAALSALGSQARVVVGGIVPDGDIPVLLAGGVSSVLRPGASVSAVVDAIADAVAAGSNS